MIWSMWAPGLQAARSCRHCSEPIPRRDAFGTSEGVCRPCRLEGDQSSIYPFRLTGSGIPLSADHAAVRHILTSPAIARRTAQYVGADHIDWDGLLAETETMSMGEGVLVRIAYDLWEANGVVAVWELARRLDRRAFERVVEALSISRGELGPGAKALHAAA